MMRVSKWGLVLVVSLLCGVQADSPRPSAQNNPGQEPFADFVYLPPPSQYTGRVFKLSQQYPAELPPKERIPAFFKIDFKTQWREYLLAARDYCFAGNVTPGGDVENDWRIAEANPPRWFHMPWQTYGPLGREGVHGLTQEAPVQSRSSRGARLTREGPHSPLGCSTSSAATRSGRSGRTTTTLTFPRAHSRKEPSFARSCSWMFPPIRFRGW